MNLMNGIIGGVFGGLIGAAIWAGISYFANYEIGWIAWGIGALVGFGCATGAKGTGFQLGVIAVIITLLSILGGKYAAVEFYINDEIGSESEDIESAVADLQDDEYVVSFLADEIIEEKYTQGETVEWPPGVDPDEAIEESDYPPAIWTDAMSQWEQKSYEDQDTYREQIAEGMRQNIHSYYADISKIGFMNSFGLMDLLFFGLAVYTAFQIASRKPEAESESESDAEEGAVG